MNYIVYNGDGDILRTGTCKSEDLNNQAGAGEYVLEGVANPSTQKVINGILADKPQTEVNIELRQIFEHDLRVKRNRLLSDTDWTQMPDSPLSSADKTKYATYRQKLRDLPASYTTETNLENVTFPEVNDD